MKRKVNESRKQIMWAINFRNMSTAIHGMYYGKDRKRVEEFANEIEYIQKNDDLDWDEKQYAWDNLMEEFPDIGTIDEFNYRDIVDLPGGYEGIEDDDTIYRFVNKGSLDIYEESTSKQKMKFRKIVDESDEGNTVSDHPRIYVGTYAKYNDGSIDGKWIDISEYNTYEEFVDACRELHADEDDPEFMVQDYENFPAKWYHEGGLPTEEEFDKINEFYMMGDEEQRAYEAYINYTNDDDIDNFHEAYQGSFSSPEDFAYDIVDQLGFDGINVDYYFDYESFGRDLTMDWHEGDPDNEDAEGEPEDPDYYYDNDGYQQEPIGTDQEVGESYVDGLGGVEQLGEQTIQNYFDYDEFGRTLLMSDYFEEDGYVFRHL